MYDEQWRRRVAEGGDGFLLTADEDQSEARRRPAPDRRGMTWSMEGAEKPPFMLLDITRTRRKVEELSASSRHKMEAISVSCWLSDAYSDEVGLGQSGECVCNIAVVP